MIKKLHFKTLLLMAVMLLGAGTAWADDELSYTFSIAKNSSNNAYASTYDVTINGLDWNVPGNQYDDGQLRIGGKDLDKVDRVITGKSPISDAITKITFNHGGVSSDKITVNSVTLTVASDAEFNSVIETVTLTPEVKKNADGSFDFVPTSGAWTANSYYKFTINVTCIDTSSNRYILVKSIEFFKEGNKTSTTTTIDFSGLTNTDLYTGNAAGQLAATVKAGDATLSNATIVWTSSKPEIATIDENGSVTLVAAGTTILTATYSGDDTYGGSSDSYELTVEYNDPNALTATFDFSTNKYNWQSTSNGDEYFDGSNYNATEKDITIGFRGKVRLWKSNETYTMRFYSDNTYGRGTLLLTAADGYLMTAVSITGSTLSFQNPSSGTINGGEWVNSDGVETLSIEKGSSTSNFTKVVVTYKPINSQKPATPTFSPAEGTFNEAQDVTISCATEGAAIYYTMVAHYENGEIYSGESVENTLYTAPIHLGWQNNKMSYSISAYAEKDGKQSNVAEATYIVNLRKQIVVSPLEIALGSEGGSGELEVSFINYPDHLSDTAGFHYWEETDTGLLPLDENVPEWFKINYSEDHSTLTYTVEPNTTNEARAIQVNFWVQNTFSDRISFTQEAYVPEYAELPFSFDGGKAAIETTGGVTQTGLGDDYGSSPKLKFNDTGDALVLKFNERPGKLTFDIKGNTFSGGTFTVQTSVDGETYTDLASYTVLGATQSEEFDNLAEDVRFIKWIYTEKSSGNVGLGNIKLEKYVTPAAPEWSELPTPTILVGQEYELNLTEYVTGNPTITMTSGTVDGADLADGVFTFTPTADGEFNFTFTATNEAGSAEASLTVTVNAATQYTLSVSSLTHVDAYIFAGTESEMLFEGEGSGFVCEGTEVMISVDPEEGYVLESLVVDGEEHVADISGGMYIFAMPNHDVTVTASAVPMTPTYYVRITSLDQLTDGSKVIIAARYDEEHTNGYYAMPGVTSGKPTGVAFTAETSGNDEILPATITAFEDDYYWTVNVTNDGYTFTNAENYLIGSTSNKTDFASGGSNIDWTITRETAEETAMVGEYTGFVIRNGNTNTRAFAFNGKAFGAYATSNMEASGYNFFLDFFVKAEPVTITDAKYATYCSNYTLDFSATGATVYKATVNTETKDVTLTAIADGIVPAEVGVIVYYDNATTIYPVVTTATSTGDWSDNELVGTLERTLVQKTSDDKFNYILQKDDQSESGIVFNIAKAEGAYMPANRAYLATTVDPITLSTGGARMNVVINGVTTGIADMMVKENTNSYYDLQGRRICNPVKGLYIVNGKKVVVK